MKEIFIERVNIATDNLNTEKVRKYLNEVYEYMLKITHRPLPEDYESFIYFPLTCDDENKIKIEDTLVDYYRNFSIDLKANPFKTEPKTSKFMSNFDLGYPGYIEYFILASVTTKNLPKNKFSTGYLMTVIISVIDSLYAHIEYFYLSRYYNYSKTASKMAFLLGLEQTSFLELAKQILKNIIDDPKITTAQLETNCSYSNSTVKRALKQMSTMAGNRGEINGVKEAVERLKITKDDIDRMG